MGKEQFETVRPLAVNTNHYFMLDKDGYYSFNYLHRFIDEVDEAYSRGDQIKVDACEQILRNVNSAVNAEIKNQKRFLKKQKKLKTASLRDKYRWMHNYYHAILETAVKQTDDRFLWLKESYKSYMNQKQ
jgi:hypothetical protein